MLSSLAQNLTRAQVEWLNFTQTYIYIYINIFHIYQRTTDELKLLLPLLLLLLLPFGQVSQWPQVTFDQFGPRGRFCFWKVQIEVQARLKCVWVCVCVGLQVSLINSTSKTVNMARQQTAAWQLTWKRCIVGTCRQSVE